MISKLKRFRKSKGKNKLNKSMNDFQNRDMLKEFEKNNRKLFKEIQKSKSALNL